MNTKTTDTGGVPDFLSRKANPELNQPAQTPKAAALTSTAPVAPVKADVPVKPSKKQAASDAAKHIAKAHNAKAKAAPKVKAKKAAKADDAEDGDEASLPKSIVPAKYKARYAEHNDTCGSALSLALKEATTHASKEQAGRVVLDVDALWAIAKANGLDYSKYVGLNNGQKRMNVGNRLVGLLNGGKDVRIGKQVFKAENHTPKKATAPKAKAKTAKAEQHAQAA